MVAEQAEVKYQTIEEDVALLREHGVRVWNSLVMYGLKLIRLRGGEEEGLRAADIALSLGLPVNCVIKEWPCTSGERWKHPQMVLQLLDFDSDELYYGFDYPNGFDASDA